MRIQIELPPSDVNALKNLMAEANIETYKDLFKNALLLLYWAVREVKNGRIIASVRAEEVDKSDISCKQIVMPILDSLAEATERGAGRGSTGQEDTSAFVREGEVMPLGEVSVPIGRSGKLTARIVTVEDPIETMQEQTVMGGTLPDVQVDEIQELIREGKYATAEERLRRIRGIGIGQKVKP